MLKLTSKLCCVAVLLATATALPLAGCCTCPPCPPCQEIAEREFAVVRVIDGDTFRVVYDGEETSVRLFGIDTPESREPGGPQAREALVELVDGRVVRLTFPAKRKRDNFGRLLCGVYVDGVDVVDAMRRYSVAR